MAEPPLREWKTSLFDCCEDCSTCCYGFWCLPCLACTVSGLFNENNCLPLCDFLTPAVLVACGIPLIVPPAAISLRASIRHKYRIQGSLCEDMAISCFCVWCSWCQMHRELKAGAPVTVVQQPPQQHTTVINVQTNPVMMVNQNPSPPPFGVQNPAQNPVMFQNPPQYPGGYQNPPQYSTEFQNPVKSPKAHNS
ncbi:cell number regulator 5-like [Xiphophorus hellerii]|uniref:cell number regulator 5-like n=1 Tax=Xiphophorus hellerii TaxID=8084 RepID=UPI0013B39798|nr:cell number regulator 5-like [Xiphophorus hellerii]